MKIIWPIFIVSLSINVTAAESQQINAELIETLLAQAETNHPMLRSAKARVDAARYNARAVRTWEDPKVIAGGMAAERMMRAEDGDLMYGVEVGLPITGKPALARKVAKAEIGVEAGDYARRKQTLRRDIAVALYKTAFAQLDLRIAAADAQWLELLLKVAEDRYSTGIGSQLDLIRAQTELARRQTEIHTLSNGVRREFAMLERSLNVRSNMVFALELPAAGTEIAFAPAMLEAAERTNPRSEVLRAEITRAQAALALTRRQRLPDFALEAQARHFSGRGDFRQSMLTLNMNLPWFNAGKYRMEIEREQSKLEAAELELADYRLELRQQLEHWTLQADAGRKQALLYQGEIIPRNEQALATARLAWETNRGSFLDVLEARRSLLEAQRLQAQSLAEQHTAVAELRQLLGTDNLPQR